MRFLEHNFWEKLLVPEWLLCSLAYIYRVVLNLDKSVCLKLYLSLIVQGFLINFLAQRIMFSLRLNYYNFQAVFFTFLNDRACKLKNSWMDHFYCSTSGVYYRTFIQVYYWIIPSDQANMKITYSWRVQRNYTNKIVRAARLCLFLFQLIQRIN